MRAVTGRPPAVPTRVAPPVRARPAPSASAARRSPDPAVRPRPRTPVSRAATSPAVAADETGELVGRMELDVGAHWGWHGRNPMPTRPTPVHPPRPRPRAPAAGRPGTCRRGCARRRVPGGPRGAGKWVRGGSAAWAGPRAPGRAGVSGRTPRRPSSPTVSPLQVSWAEVMAHEAVRAAWADARVAMTVFCAEETLQARRTDGRGLEVGWGRAGVPAGPSAPMFRPPTLNPEPVSAGSF